MERLSALMDNELDDHQVASEIEKFGEDPDRQTAWETYHLIGEVLRGELAGEAAVLGVDVTRRVAERLASEPAIVARPRPERAATRVRQVALPLAASVCGVALVAWLVLSQESAMPPRPQLASEGMVATTQSGTSGSPELARGDASGQGAARIDLDTMVAANSGSDSSDAEAMADYMMAHQQFSPSTAMQGVVPYVRTVAATDIAR